MTSFDDNHSQYDATLMNWIELERSLREILRLKSPELFATVSAILFECDPIGLNYDDNTDEYDAEAGSIIPRLPVCVSEADTRKMIHEEFSKWFSDTAGDEYQYSECARRIWQLWQSQYGHHTT